MQALGSLDILDGLNDFTLRNQSEVINILFQNIPPRAGVISVPPQSRPPPPAHPGAPRHIAEVHPGAPRPTPDNHPGAPRPVPEAQNKPAELPLGM